MDTIAIRRAGPESFDPAFKLLQRFFAEEGFTTPPERIRQNLAAFLDNDGYAVFLMYRQASALAHRQAEAVGIATVSTSISIELGRMAEIDDLYVLPEARNLGLAKRLIEAAMEWLRSEGGIYAQVTVTPEGEAAHGLIRFYIKLGFHQTGRTLLAQNL